MAVQILSQSYGPRKPLIECTADSLSDLEGLVCAEGSKATVGGTEYVLDRVNGWVEPGSGGGGGSGVLVVHETYDESAGTYTLDKTWQEIYDGIGAGVGYFIFVAATDAGVDVEHRHLYYFSEAYYDPVESAYVVKPSGFTEYFAEAPDDYPVREE